MRDRVKLSPFVAADDLVRVYPGHVSNAPHRPGLLWLHGGGFHAGDIDMPEADWVARSLAERGVTVVSVDYRLAPRWVYPAASDDVLEAWAWTLDHAHELAIDTDLLGIGGASAGGNLAAGATIRMISGEVGAMALPSRAVLIYPTLHAEQHSPDDALREALNRNPDADRFGPDALRTMYAQYLSTDMSRAPTGAVPGIGGTEELIGFPSTLIVCSEVDELRMSAQSFSETLSAAGTDVTYRVEPDTVHGFLNTVTEPAATNCICQIVEHMMPIA